MLRVLLKRSKRKYHLSEIKPHFFRTGEIFMNGGDVMIAYGDDGNGIATEVQCLFKDRTKIKNKEEQLCQ